jgi:hypothetical protein
MPDMSDQADSATGGRAPFTGAERATVAQVVRIAAGVLAMVTGLQRLPFKTSGARFRIRLPTGTYSFNAVGAWGDSSGDTLYIPPDKTIAASRRPTSRIGLPPS